MNEGPEGGHDVLVLEIGYELSESKETTGTEMVS